MRLRRAGSTVGEPFGGAGLEEIGCEVLAGVLPQGEELRAYHHHPDILDFTLLWESLLDIECIQLYL